MRFRARELVRAIGKRCRSAGLPFDLDIDWLTGRLESGRCELTGLEFDTVVSRKRGGPFSPSVDRIVPSAGYTKSNCRVVIFAVNAALSDWGLGVFIPIAEALVARTRKEPAA
jgi:hypothetical protein